MHIDLQQISIYIVCLAISITLHEFMHAFIGYKLGDSTAKSRGRISFNPLDHIDPLTTLALPIFMIILGLPPILAAKPVPIQTQNLKYKEWGFMLVALAGPLTNLILAAIGAILFRAIPISTGIVPTFLGNFTILNISMFVFNMIPFPPLDGSRVIYAIGGDAVRRILNQIEGYGMVAIFPLIILIQQNILNISAPINYLVRIFLGL